MFEGRLARRYIGTQKRHSALTVCSIAIALALITMLFSMFSTVINTLRSIAHNEGDYHIRITFVDNEWMSMEQYNAIAEYVSKFGTCTLLDTDSAEVRPWADILLDKSIDDAGLFVDRIASHIGADKLDYYTNDMLMTLDMADSHSQLNMAAVIAVFYVFVLFLIMMLRLIIDTAFEISSKERERQFGVLQSIGATPKQIVRIITYEGLMLSVIGIPIGTAAGIGLGYLAYRTVINTGLADLYLSRANAAKLVHFSVNPWLLLLGIVTGLVWVLLSAYGTGMRVIKMSPVEAISRRVNTVKKVPKAAVFGKLFGWTGKIASRNNMRQPKRFIATVVSLTLSIALFSAVTVVVSDLRGAAEEYYYDKPGEQSDFIVYLPYRDNGDDPLTYRKYLKKVEESGLFEEVDFGINVHGSFYVSEDDDEFNSGYSNVDVCYLNRKSYNDLFDGDPPVSYEELTESGGYIAGKWLSAQIGSEKSVSLEFPEKRMITYSEEEYNELPPEEKEKCGVKISNGSYDQNGEMVYRYGYTPKFLLEFDVYYKADSSAEGLIATLDQYENGAYSLFTEAAALWGGDVIFCDLIDKDDYFEALDYMDENNISYSDNTAENRKLRATLASVNIVASFFSILVALIAVVNMVNILATGILNRRGELAALQCVGMTEKELRRMTIIECMQYALISGAAAVAVCELLMFLTEKMLGIVIDMVEYLGDYISYVQPLPIIGIASLCAFLIAIAASVIPLRAMRKNTLVEQIRSVE